MSEDVKTMGVECSRCGREYTRTYDAKYITEALAGANVEGLDRAFIHGPCYCQEDEVKLFIS